MNEMNKDSIIARERKAFVESQLIDLTEEEEAEEFEKEAKATEKKIMGETE